jgi:hypothetical protein
MLPDSINGDDVSVLRLRVWCLSPGQLPTVLDLHAEEPTIFDEDGN